MLARRTAAACLAAVLSAGSVAAEPYVPAHDAVVLEQVPLISGPERAELRQMRQALAADPGNLPLALRLANRYVELGRVDGDPRYAGWAEAALRPWWDLPEPSAAVLVLRATVLQNRHAFDAALQDLRRALARAPRDGQARLTEATILRVQGMPREAAAACGALFGLADVLAATTCLADATSLNGRAEDSYERLAAAYGAYGGASDDEPDRRQRLWTLAVLAEIAVRRGDAAAAERHFRDALALGAGDSALLAAYADHLLDQDRAADARRLLTGRTGADALLLRLALAERRLGAPQAARSVERLAARFDAARARGDRVHLREEARFRLELLDDAAAALPLAVENWRVQREPDDARLLLQAALAAGAPASARPVLAWLEETGLEDVRLTPLVRRLRESAS